MMNLKVTLFVIVGVKSVIDSESLKETTSIFRWITHHPGTNNSV